MQTSQPQGTQQTSPLTATFVTVRVENTPGQLGRCARSIAQAGINVEGFCADTAGARFLTNNPNQTAEVLRKAGFQPEVREFFAIRLPNEPGQVALLGEELGKAGVNIETCFGVGGTREAGRIFCQVNDPTRARPVFERLATVQATTGSSPRP